MVRDRIAYVFFRVGVWGHAASLCLPWLRYPRESPWYPWGGLQRDRGGSE